MELTIVNETGVKKWNQYRKDFLTLMKQAQEKVGFKDVAAMAVLAALIAPGKTVYIVVAALCFIIPLEKFKSKKAAIVSFAVILGCAVALWVAVNTVTVFSMLNTTTPPPVTEEIVTGEDGEIIIEEHYYDMYSDIAPNGDNRNFFGIGYILGHIPQTIKLVLNTVQENGVLYIQQIFGGILGEVIVSPVKINWLYTIATMFVVFLSTVKTQGTELVHKGVRKWWSLLLAVGACGLFCLACITWTPINYTTVFGIQGRYFYPVLPLIVLFFTNDNISIKKNIDGALLYALAVINVLVMLDGFTIMAVNTSMIYK